MTIPIRVLAQKLDRKSALLRYESLLSYLSYGNPQLIAIWNFEICSFLHIRIFALAYAHPACESRALFVFCAIP
jgi:hypothetical protein